MGQRLLEHFLVARVPCGFQVSENSLAIQFQAFALRLAGHLLRCQLGLLSEQVACFGRLDLRFNGFAFPSARHHSPPGDLVPTTIGRSCCHYGTSSDRCGGTEMITWESLGIEPASRRANTDCDCDFIPPRGLQQRATVATTAVFLQPAVSGPCGPGDVLPRGEADSARSRNRRIRWSLQADLVATQTSRVLAVDRQTHGDRLGAPASAENHPRKRILAIARLRYYDPRSL